MTRRLLLPLFISVLALLPALASAAGPEETALLLVQKYRLGDNLVILGYQGGSMTQTYRIMVKAVGEPKARAILVEEITKAAPSYQERWNRNLAAAYAQVLSAERLHSLLQLGPASPYSTEMRGRQGEIGAIMRARSMPIVQAMMVQVIQPAFARAVPKP